MNTEREVILSVLKLTKSGLIQKDLIAKDAHTPTAIADEALRTLSEKGLIQQKGNTIETQPNQRLQLAIEAIKQGADPQRACRFLEWQEFENIAATAFEINHYTVHRNFHFKAGEKRWEIDLVACRQPLIVCADCKHWQHGWSSASIQKAADAQVERTKALADSLQSFTDKLRLNKWTHATFLPIVISLLPGTFKFHNNTPIVPVLQLQSLINELPAQTVSLTHFSTIVKERGTELTEF